MDDDADELVTINSYPSERVAREWATKLVEEGVGAVIEPGLPLDHRPADVGVDGVDGPPGRNTDEYAARFDIRVMRHQVPTACELLGVDLPEVVVIDEPEPAVKGTPWKRILIIWAVAMVVIPVGTGFATYLILNR